jgi:hypothetical protein
VILILLVCTNDQTHGYTPVSQEEEKDLDSLKRLLCFPAKKREIIMRVRVLFFRIIRIRVES